MGGGGVSQSQCTFLEAPMKRSLAFGGLDWDPFVSGNCHIKVYLEVHCTYNLLSNCSYNLNISPITIVTLGIIGL